MADITVYYGVYDAAVFHVLCCHIYKPHAIMDIVSAYYIAGNW